MKTLDCRVIDHLDHLALEQEGWLGLLAGWELGEGATKRPIIAY